MIYTVELDADACAINVGAIDNKPLVPVIAFRDEAARAAQENLIWKGGNGKKLVRISRRQVVAWFGKEFSVLSNGHVCRGYQADDYQAVIDEIIMEDISFRVPGVYM